MANPLRVLFVSSECTPFAKTGGLGDVIGALPLTLRRRGIDVRIVMPLYAGLPWQHLERLDGTLTVPMWYGDAHAGVRLGHLGEGAVPIYFLEHLHYFDRPDVYGTGGEDYRDNLERFSFLSRGALELCKALAWIPDIVHSHDWPTALAPLYLRTVERHGPLAHTASVHTIHNLAYQGIHDIDSFGVTNLPASEARRATEHAGALNLAKAGISESTIVTTVSPTYAREILTPEGGCTLHGELQARGSCLLGILNGIDADDWDPGHDQQIAANFDARNLGGKAVCKAALQAEAGLPVREDVPIFALASRLAAQKGIDVLAHALNRILDWPVQVIVLGTGQPEAERYFAWLAGQRRERFAAWLDYSDARAHRLLAGADFVMMPSRFEPCGLTQLYGLRYGAVPIVRATGGLADTVANYDEISGEGTGFVFRDLTPASLTNTIGWALSTWHDRPIHYRALQRRGMSQDFSWERAAATYEDAYRTAIARHMEYA